MDKINVVIGGVNIELEKEAVSKAIEAGELKIESDQIIAKEEGQIIYSKEEFDAFQTNHGNEEYKKGKTAGVEMTIKDAREKYGLEFEGKTIDNFAEAFKSKILSESSVKPNEKIQELEADKKKLQENYSGLENEFNAYKNEQSEKETRAKKDAKLMSYIPDTGLKVDKDIALMSLKFKAGIDIGYDDNNREVPLRNGEVVKGEKTLEPVEIDVFVKENITALNLFEGKPNGNGDSDDPGTGTASNYDKFVAEMEKQGKSSGSLAFNEEMNARIKAGTLKI